jgi:hypothetical protein
LPSASKSSWSMSGCLAFRAIRSISACNCSAVIGRCRWFPSACDFPR